MCGASGGYRVYSGGTRASLMTTIIKETTMKIKINNLSPEIATLKMTKVHDIYGSVLVMRGWA